MIKNNQLYKWASRSNTSMSTLVQNFILLVSFGLYCSVDMSELRTELNDVFLWNYLFRQCRSMESLGCLLIGFHLKDSLTVSHGILLELPNTIWKDNPSSSSSNELNKRIRCWGVNSVRLPKLKSKVFSFID